MTDETSLQGQGLASGPPITKPKLLLADDSATIRKVVELTFADEGIDVSAVADAASAMEEFVRTPPDIVLVDVSLPGTSGYQICEMIKQDEATSRIPVLLLVGSFEPFDQDEAERVRADGFLLKPFKSIRELVDRVKELLPAQVSDESFAKKVEETGRWTDAGPEEDGSQITDIDALYEQSFQDTEEMQEFETVDEMLTDSGMDDELIEAKTLAEGDDKIGHQSTDTAANQLSVSSYPSGLLDDSPQKTENREVDPFLSKADISGQTPTGQNSDEEMPADRDAVPRVQSFEPSEEFITLVVNRVVERLSGREVREVAREVVPRIAEKLIREALAEEKKS
jgi:CheY-like chemotaxis protein